MDEIFTIEAEALRPDAGITCVMCGNSPAQWGVCIHGMDYYEEDEKNYVEADDLYVCNECFCHSIQYPEYIS